MALVGLIVTPRVAVSVEINSRGLSATEALYINTMDNMRYLSLRESSLQHVRIMPLVQSSYQNQTVSESCDPRQDKWYASLCLIGSTWLTSIITLSISSDAHRRGDIIKMIQMTSPYSSVWRRSLSTSGHMRCAAGRCFFHPEYRAAWVKTRIVMCNL